MNKRLLPLLCFSLCLSILTFAQTTDSTAVEEEDYDQYGEVDYADGKANKTYANARIVGTAPQRFVSVGWDWQAPYTMQLSRIGSYAEDAVLANDPFGSGDVVSTGGLRLIANIPVISRNNFIWQLGGTYWETGYKINNIQGDSSATGVMNELNQKGLRTAGLNSILYKPLNEHQFILVQASLDMSGGYDLSLQGQTRLSLAALWGNRPHDRLQWAVGVSRTYRVGAMNYLPIFMYNWTSVNRKWGVEALVPARGSVRYNFSVTSLLMAGFELEGQSYRINNFSDLPAGQNQSLEIRRGELRPRIEYQRQLYGFFWIGAQVGYRINYIYNADYLPNGKEFFRGFTGAQPFAMLNNIGNAPYVNLTINFVSP
jgi:hypothetical protein